MGDQQHALAIQFALQALDRGQHAVGEIAHRFGIRRGEAVRIVPELAEGLAVFQQDFRRIAPFPVTEMQFAQVGLDAQRYARLLGQLTGKGLAAGQRRTDDQVPRRLSGHGGTHLLPATLGQRCIGAAMEAATGSGFTVAQEFELQSHGVRSSTEASEKVAICPCRAQARRNRGIASAAPLPSPRRRPRCSSGWPSRACST